MPSLAQTYSIFFVGSVGAVDDFSYPGGTTPYSFNGSFVGGAVEIGLNPSGGGGPGTLFQLGGLISTGSTYVGLLSEGTFIQNGGTHIASDRLEVGRPGANGTYYLNGGDLFTDGTVIGKPGSTGTFNQSGGTHTARYLNVGFEPSSFGTQAFYTLSGVSSLSTTSSGVGGEFGTGTFTQSGGTHTVGAQLAVGTEGGNGFYGLSAGALSTGSTVIGRAGTGRFDQNGGSHTVGGSLDVGRFSGNGTYNLTAGNLSTIFTAVGNDGTGTFSQSGGTHTASNNLTLGFGLGGNGTYNLSGGSLSTVDMNIGAAGTGTLVQTGGSNTVSNVLLIGEHPGGIGTYTMTDPGGPFNPTNPTAAANTLIVGQSGSGTFSQGGGTVTAGTLLIGNNVGSSGVYLLNSNGPFMPNVELRATTEVIGNAGAGRLDQGGGSGLSGDITRNIVSGSLFLGNQVTGVGSYNLANTFLTVGGNEIVGNSGKGFFDHSAGLNAVNGALVVGQNVAGLGKYTMSDPFAAFGFSPQLSVAGNIIVGGSGHGTFDQQAGTVIAQQNLLIGRNNTVVSPGVTVQGVGSYSLSGGSLNVGLSTVVGSAGQGTFTQSGGTHNVGSTLVLGLSGSGIGNYAMQGGTLNTTNMVVGSAGAGTFQQTNGISNVTGTLTLASQVGGAGTYNLQGGVLNAQNVQINSGGNFNQSGGTQTISGTMNNGGTLTLAGGTLNNIGQINNSGQFSILAGGSVTGTGIYTQTAGTTVVNGSMTQAGGVNVNGGVLQGTGSISGPVTVDGGTIAAGNSPGTLTIEGDLAFEGGTIVFEVAGTGAGEFDVLHVTGAASFAAGTIEFSFLDGFLPHAGDHWQFLVIDGGVTGLGNLQATFLGLPADSNFTFAMVGNGLEVSYGVAAVPEPETYALLLAGLGLLGFVARRRKLKETAAA